MIGRLSPDRSGRESVISTRYAWKADSESGELGHTGQCRRGLQKHVELEAEGIDRMYLNAYVPRLQTVEGALGFIRHHRGHKVPSTAMVEPITRAFVQAIEQFVADQQIPLITFEKGERKDDVAARLRRTFKAEEGVVFVGKAQEKCRVYRTEKAIQPQHQNEIRVDREIDCPREPLLLLLCRPRLRTILSEVLIVLSLPTASCA